MQQSDYKPNEVAGLVCEWPAHIPTSRWCKEPASWQWDRTQTHLREGTDALALCQGHYECLEEGMTAKVTPSQGEYITTEASSCVCEWPSHSAFNHTISSCCRKHATHQIPGQIPGSNPHLDKKAPGDDRPCYICQEHYDALADESPSLESIPTSLADYLAQIEEEAEV